MDSHDCRVAWRRHHLKVLLLVVAIGVACRLCQYLSRRSYWHDESFLLANLREKSAAELMGPLDARPLAPQAAPPGYLLLEKSALGLLGTSELSMRLAPQILALLALPLIARIASITLPPLAAVWVIAVFAFSDHLIVHSAEMKQYSSDVFFSLLMLWLAIEGKSANALSARRFARLTAVAAIGVWFSHPMLFTFCGVALAFLVSAWRQDWRDVMRIALLSVGVGASFMLLYVLVLRNQQSPTLYQYWETDLADWHRPLRVPIWILTESRDLANYSAQNAGPAVLVLGIIGGIALWRRDSRFGGRRAWLVILLAPIAICLVAAAVHVYPFGGTRATLFLAPTVCLLAGAGFQAFITHPLKSLRVSGWLLAGAAVSILLAQAMYCLAVPRTRSHLRPAVDFMLAHRQPGDAVWVHRLTTSEVYLCYVPHPDALTSLNVDESKPFPSGRFWLLFAGNPGRLPATMNPQLERARAVARLQQSFATRGGAAFLFEHD